MDQGLINYNRIGGSKNGMKLVEDEDVDHNDSGVIDVAFVTEAAAMDDNSAIPHHFIRRPMVQKISIRSTGRNQALTQQST